MMLDCSDFSGVNLTGDMAKYAVMWSDDQDTIVSSACEHDLTLHEIERIAPILGLENTMFLMTLGNLDIVKFTPHVSDLWDMGVIDELFLHDVVENNPHCSDELVMCAVNSGCLFAVNKDNHNLSEEVSAVLMDKYPQCNVPGHVNPKDVHRLNGESIQCNPHLDQSVYLDYIAHNNGDDDAMSELANNPGLGADAIRKMLKVCPVEGSVSYRLSLHPNIPDDVRNKLTWPGTATKETARRMMDTDFYKISFLFNPNITDDMRLEVIDHLSYEISNKFITNLRTFDFAPLLNDRHVVKKMVEGGIKDKGIFLRVRDDDEIIGSHEVYESWRETYLQ